MHTVNLHQAKTNLSRLIETAAAGETVVITKAGKPVAKLTAVDIPSARPSRRIGFMDEQFTVADDFDTIGAPEIERLFTNGTA